MNPKLNINESFICRIWEGAGEYYSDLIADCGEKVEVIDYGKRNYDSGPDYKDAKVKIGGKTFTGDIEIHRDFKNWAEHDHPKDSRYNSVILHVVLWDSEIKTAPKLRIKRDLPTVILANHLNNSIHNIWQDIISRPSEKFKLPCCDLNKSVDDIVIKKWFKKLAVQRLKLKSERLKERLIEIGKKTFNKSGENLKSKKAWEQVFYEFIFEALGFSKNKEQMLRLSSNLNLEFIQKLTKKYDVLLIQSLLYGAAGLLFDLRHKDEYIDIIKESWKKSEDKIKIPRLNKSEWNFFRLRPQNFPTIRIAYGSQLILKILEGDLFKNIILSFQREFSVTGLYRNLQALLKPEEDKYWNVHYDFGKRSANFNKLLGRQRINDIIINVITPVVYLYSEIFKNGMIKKNVLILYDTLKIKPENSVLNVIKEQVLISRDIQINTPSMEQAAIQLYNFYCTRERCSECEIGKLALNRKGMDYKIIFY